MSVDADSATQVSNVQEEKVPSLDALAKANMALDSISLSKTKTIANLTAVDSSMQTLVALKKFTFWALILSIIIILMNILIVVAATYIEYNDVIKVVNNNASAVQGAPGGFATAIAIKFPVLAKLVGFLNSSYPLAVFFCVRDPTINAVFSQNEGEYMNKMWQQESMGLGCSAIPNATGLASPAVLVCCQVMSDSAMCGGPCNAYSSTSTASSIQNGIMGAMNFGMLGADFGGPVGGVIGALIGVAVSVGSSVAANKSSSG
jgi:hypothetical protein